MIEKLAKEFEKIRASLAKSKKLIVADIDKIDEKYRRLAQEEKKSLTENLAILNEQLKYYDKMLGDERVQEEFDTEEHEDFEHQEPATDLPEPKEEEEKPIEDTIFPENNEPEHEPMKEEKVEEVVEEKAEPVAEPEKKSEEPAIEDIPEITDTDWGDVQNAKTDENGWPVW